MSFAAPFFLYLLPLAGLPVVFHLMMKEKRVQMTFPSFLFFYATDPKVSSRRKLRERILLILRVLFILLLLLALSRPVIDWFKMENDEVALAVVVDNSASMRMLGPNNQTKLDIAREGARSLVKSVKKGSQVGLYLGVEDFSMNAEGLSSNSNNFYASLEQVQNTDARARFDVTLRKALGDLRESPSNLALALHVFTDLQTHEWEGEVWNLPETNRPVRVVIHSIPTAGEKVDNAVLESVSLPEGLVLSGQNMVLTANLRNDSNRPLSLQLNTENNQHETTNQTVMLDPKSSKTVELSLTPREEGLHWFRVWLEGDQFVADNQVVVGLRSLPMQKVVLVGQASDYGLLPKLISPTGNGNHTSLLPIFVPAEKLISSIGEKPALVILHWENLGKVSAAFPALENYVREGGGLFIVSSTQGGSGNQFPSWLTVRPTALENFAAPRRLLIKDRMNSLWGEFRRARGGIPPMVFSVRKHNALTLSGEEISQLMTTIDGKNLLTTQTLGEGRITCAGFAMTPQWSSVATDPSGIAMILMYQAATSSLGDSASVQSVVAGESLQGPMFKSQEVKLTPFYGDHLDVTLPPSRLPPFPRSGVFLIDDGGQQTCVSVFPSGTEGRAAFTSSNDKLSGLGEQDYEIEELKDYNQLEKRLLANQAGVALIVPLLLLAVLVWTIESVYANWPKRARMMSHQEVAS
ncbi:MAG: BatA and WFA domain-containing protein [Verrucomicrobiota bacterium]